MDHSPIIVAVLAGLVLLRWGILAFGALLIIGPVSGCPACFEETFPVRRRWLRPLSSRFEWRWCPSCGWEGPARKGGSEASPAHAPEPRLRRGSPARGEPRV